MKGTPMKRQIDVSELEAGMQFDLAGYTYVVHDASPTKNDAGIMYMWMQFYLVGLQPTHENINAMCIRYGRSFEIS
jgi:hypothetical protein